MKVDYISIKVVLHGERDFIEKYEILIFQGTNQMSRLLQSLIWPLELLFVL